jgi:hypothetical protein
MKKLLSTLMGLVAFNVLADVIIYDNHLTYTWTGNGIASRMSDSGFSVLDVPTGNFTQLILFISKKDFHVLSLATDIHYVTGDSGKDIMVVYIQPSSGASGMGTATGIATSLNTGTQSYTAARMLTVDSSYINQMLEYTNTYWQSVKGSVTFDSTRTVTQNQIDGNYTNTVQRLKQLLISEGYFEPLLPH